MSNFVNDTLAGTNGTLLSAHTGGDGTTWAEVSGFSGVSTIQSNAVTFNGSYSLFAATGPSAPSSANYSVAATVATNGSTAGLAGVVARLSSGGTGYVLVCHTGGYLALYRLDASNTQVLLDQYNFTPGASQTIRLVVNGTGISGYLNGSLVVSAVDSTYSAAGHAGIYGNTGSTSSWAISNILGLNGGADGATFVSVTDSNLFFSPYTWYLNGSTYAQTNNSGAYFKFCAGATTYLSIKYDVSTLVAAGATSAQYPVLRTYLDNNGAYTTQNLYNSTLGITFTGLTSGTHYFQQGVEQLSQVIDRWNTPSNVVRITAIVIDNGATTLTPANQVSIRPKRAIVFGDSIGEGYGTLNALQAPSAAVGPLLDAEIGNVCYAGQSFATAGVSNVPAMNSAMNYYYSGQSRLVGGVLSPAPDYVVCLQGENGGATTDVNTALTNFRTIAPNARLIVVTPFSGMNASNIAAATLPDSNGVIINLSNRTANPNGFGRTTSIRTPSATRSPRGCLVGLWGMPCRAPAPVRTRRR